jgi:cytochrome c biogenesis protein CcmG, thiol:disulfide interchange protein DsbE
LKTKAAILLIILLAGLAVVFLLIRHQPGSSVARIGSPAPDAELIDINRNEIKLSDMRGSVVLVNFWATWCQSCVSEMPSIEALFGQMSGNMKFRLVTILFRDDEYRALSYMKGNGYNFPVFLNPDGSAARKFGITGVPETFIIDKKGILRDKVIGPADWGTPGVVKALGDLINEE